MLLCLLTKPAEARPQKVKNQSIYLEQMRCCQILFLLRLASKFISLATKAGVETASGE